MTDAHPDHNEDLVEDNFLSETLAGLSPVQVPSNFLPGVMHRVYEKHYRDKVPLSFILSAGVLLLFLTATFFVLDVSEYGEQRGLSSFGEAFDMKIGLLTDRCSGFIEGVGDLFSATWQIVSGAAGSVSTGTLIGLFLGLALILYLIKKGLTALMGG